MPPAKQSIFLNQYVLPQVTNHDIQGILMTLLSNKITSSYITSQEIEPGVFYSGLDSYDQVEVLRTKNALNRERLENHFNNRIDQVVYDELVSKILSLPTTEQSNFIKHNLPNITNSEIQEKLTKLLVPLEEQSSITSTCTIAASQPDDGSLPGTESDG